MASYNERVLGALSSLRRRLPRRGWQGLLRVHWNLQWFFEHLRQMWAAKFWVARPHGAERAIVIEELSRFYPFESLLEVGCELGQHLLILDQYFPSVTKIGVDIDQGSVDGGNAYLRETGRHSIELRVGDGTDLGDYAENSFDIVCSSAALLFFDEHQVVAALQEMIRVARKGVVLLELHEAESGYGYLSAENMDNAPYWVRDYRALVGEICPEAKLRMRRVTNPRFDTERWEDLGWVISLEIS